MMKDFDTWLLDFKAGKKTATNQLYELYRIPFVKWLIQKHHCEEETAVNVFHDSIIVLYKNAQRGKLDNLTSQLKTYFFAVGRNVFLEWRRRQKHTEPESLSVLMESPEEGVEKQLQRRDRKKLMAKLLKEMANPCQGILYLFYYRQYSIEAIQKAMNYKSIDVVRTQKKRCVKAFKRQFEKVLKKLDY